jgi:transposase-like protein
MELSKEKAKEELSPRRYSHYSKEFKLQVVNEYLQGARLCDLIRKYSLNGYTTIMPWIHIFASKPIKHVKMDESDSEKELKRLSQTLHLKEKELQFEKDRNMALNKLIDLADEELKTDIRKKSGAKQ